jgi:hypothetical protein
MGWPTEGKAGVPGVRELSAIALYAWEREGSGGEEEEEEEEEEGAEGADDDDDGPSSLPTRERRSDEAGTGPEASPAAPSPSPDDNADADADAAGRLPRREAGMATDGSRA